MRLGGLHEEREERGGDEEGAESGEVGDDGELPGAADFEGLDEDGPGAMDRRRDGFRG